MSARDPFEAIRAELAKLEARPGLAKAESAKESFRSRQRSKAWAVFCAGVDALLQARWSMRRIAQAMEVDPVTLKDWYEQGDRQRSQLPAWAFAALPREAQPAMMRAQLEWAEEEIPGRTGTHD